MLESWIILRRQDKRKELPENLFARPMVCFGDAQPSDDEADGLHDGSHDATRWTKKYIPMKG